MTGSRAKTFERTEFVRAMQKFYPDADVTRPCERIMHRCGTMGRLRAEFPLDAKDRHRFAHAFAVVLLVQMESFPGHLARLHWESTLLVSIGDVWVPTS